MLNKIKIDFYRAKFILNSNKFKVVSLMIILVCIANLFNIPIGIKYEQAILFSVTSTMLLFVLISALFISSCITLYQFDKDYPILLRFESKFEYLKKLFLTITIINFIIFCFAISITVLLVTFKFFGNISFENLSYYKIPYIFYNLLIVFKQFIIIDILSIFGILLYKIFNKLMCYIYYALILVIYYVYPISINIISDYHFNNLFFKYYLVPYQYTNLLLEITSFVITTCIMLLIIFLMLFFTVKFNKIKIDE